MTDHILNHIRKSLINIDPLSWAEKHLTLDGKPFRIRGNGYKPIADIIRYMGIKALEKDSLPMVWVKGRQVSGTTTSCAIDMFCMGSGNFGNEFNPPMRVAHLFPQLDLAEAFSKVKLNAMIDGSIDPDVDAPKIKGQKNKSYLRSKIDGSSESNDSNKFKQFVGGNHLWIDSVGLDGSRLRGRTCDVAVYDECQQIPEAAIANTNKILTKSQYGSVGNGVQIYLGTPLQRGSVFWEMWNQSTQQYYHLGCGKCKQYFPLYTPGTNEWEEIWIYGFTVRCPHCGFEQHKVEATERGKWIATKSQQDAKYIGFHLNQLYMPEFTKEKIISEKPENNPLNTERTYQNEVLGEFFSGEAGIISVDQIREICGDPERKFIREISADENQLVFLGVDIGGQNDLEQLVDGRKAVIQGQSYSTAVVLRMSGPQRFSIEYACKFPKNDLGYKKGLIEQLMRRYSVNLGVIDLGYTGDLSEILQTEFGDRFLSSQASHRVNNHAKYNDQVFPKVITFERDYWIMDMYEQMKKGNVRFPLGSFEQINWLMQHCTAFEIKPSVSRTGEVSPTYKKSGKNDGFMALLNAYIAYKYWVSEGFDIKNPNMFSDKSKRKIPLVLGYVPKL
jgi:Phage terminase large subunit gpA, ATPase domain